MSTATKGRAAEHEYRDLLEADDYLVTRSAGSKGVADLWVFRPDGTWFAVSIKCGSARDSRAEIARKKQIVEAYGGRLLLARRREGRLKPGQDRWIEEWA